MNGDMSKRKEAHLSKKNTSQQLVLTLKKDANVFYLI